MTRLADSLRRRRPGAPMLVALLALFVALGGPAQAARLANGVAATLTRGSVTSKQVKDHSLQVSDLSRKTVRRLQRTPRGSVTESRLHNGAVTPGKLAKGAVRSTAIADRAVRGGDIGLGAVGSLEVADNSLTGADVADGGLNASDIGRFWGHFTISIPTVAAYKCWHGDPVGLAAERSNSDIAGDVITITPGRMWPDDANSAGTGSALAFTAHVSTTPSRFTIIACNPTGTAIPAVATSVPFNYIIVDVP
jgi:hypothetical protein